MKKLHLIWIIFSPISWLSAQSYSADSSYVSAALLNAQTIYKEKIKDNIHLFEGIDYRPYHNSNDQHPYFKEDWLVGSVFYNGSLFTNEEMLYDIFKDKIIIQDYFGGNSVQLVSEKVDYFLLDGHTFVWIPNSELQPGFYDLLVDGEIKFYARRTKEFKEIISSNTIEEEFNEKNKYYLFRNNTFYPIKSKRSVRLVLSDFEDNVNKILREQTLPFRRDFERSVISIIKSCNEL